MKTKSFFFIPYLVCSRIKIFLELVRNEYLNLRAWHSDIDKLKLHTKLYILEIIWMPCSAAGWLRLGRRLGHFISDMTNLASTIFPPIYPVNRVAGYIKQSPELTGKEPLTLRCIQEDIPIVGAFLPKSIDNFGILIPSLI